jgi:hypothetical protein
MNGNEPPCSNNSISAAGSEQDFPLLDSSSEIVNLLDLAKSIPSVAISSISMPSNETTLLGDTGALQDRYLADCHLSSRKVPEISEVPEQLLGDTGVLKDNDRIQSNSTELSPSKVMESLLGDTGVLKDNSYPSLDSTELSPSKVMESLLGDTGVLNDNSYPKLDSTELSPSKKEIENIKRPRRRRVRQAQTLDLFTTRKGGEGSRIRSHGQTDQGNSGSDQFPEGTGGFRGI